MFNSQIRSACTIGIFVQICWLGSMAAADSVRLTNGDIVRGEVVLLNKDQLVLRSENFGEMEIPRDKVALIGLGDQSVQPTSVPASKAGEGATAGNPTDNLPSLQNPQVRQQIDRLLKQTLGGEGIGSLGNMQTDLTETSRGLKDLQKDLGPGPGADALDGYIKLFELFGGGKPTAEAQNDPQ